MKRAMTGGAHRGPVAPGRQRRTLRFMQLLLVVTAAALLMFAGYSWGRARGYDQGRRAGELGAPRRPSPVQSAFLGALGLVTLGAALLLQGPEGPRLPVPADAVEPRAGAE